MGLWRGYHAQRRAAAAIDVEDGAVMSGGRKLDQDNGGLLRKIFLHYFICSLSTWSHLMNVGDVDGRARGLDSKLRSRTLSSPVVTPLQHVELPSTLT